MRMEFRGCVLCCANLDKISKSPPSTALSCVIMRERRDHALSCIAHAWSRIIINFPTFFLFVIHAWSCRTQNIVPLTTCEPCIIKKYTFSSPLIVHAHSSREVARSISTPTASTSCSCWELRWQRLSPTCDVLPLSWPKSWSWRWSVIIVMTRRVTISTVVEIGGLRSMGAPGVELAIGNFEDSLSRQLHVGYAQISRGVAGSLGKGWGEVIWMLGNDWGNGNRVSCVECPDIHEWSRNLPKNLEKIQSRTIMHDHAQFMHYHSLSRMITHDHGLATHYHSVHTLSCIITHDHGILSIFAEQMCT